MMHITVTKCLTIVAFGLLAEPCEERLAGGGSQYGYCVICGLKLPRR